MTREMISVIYDAITNDPCIMPLLDDADPTQHGSADFCDQPITSHQGRPVRRYEQGWPGDFQHCVVCFGRFAKSPYSINTPRWMEAWTFLAGVWVIQTVSNDEGQSSTGDLWAADVHDHLVRILGWQQTPQPCAADIIILRRDHTGDVTPLSFDNEKGVWWWVAQFNWLVVSRGLQVPAEACACA